MKKIALYIVAFLTFSSSYALQEKNLQETDEINATIEKLLSAAEESINRVDFDMALKQLNRALDLSRKIDHPRLIALTSSMMAQLYYVRNENDKATTELQRAISIQREIGDEAGLAYSYLNFGKIFNAKNDYERAKGYYDLSETLYLKQENSEGLG
ncbi:MAG: hybrid sensor histidine kinase/response regulator, partial [Salinimicrobium sp.]